MAPPGRSFGSPLPCPQVSMGVNRGVAELKAGKFWEKIQMKLKASDPHNCLLQSGPDSAKDLPRPPPHLPTPVPRVANPVAMWREIECNIYNRIQYIYIYIYSNTI